MLRTTCQTMRGLINRLRQSTRGPAFMIRWLTVLSLAIPCGMLSLGGFVLFDLRTDAWNRSEQASDNLISIGVAATRPESRHGIAVLVKEADDALYLAKRSGRNQGAGGAAWDTDPALQPAGLVGTT